MSIVTQTSLPVNTPDVVLKNVPCNAGVSVGDWVRIDVGTETAIKAQADSVANSLVMGLVEAKNDATHANIRTAGLSSIAFVGLSVNEEYVLSAATAGAMGSRSTTVPTGAGNVIAPLGLPLNSTQFVVRVGLRMVRS